MTNVANNPLNNVKWILCVKYIEWHIMNTTKYTHTMTFNINQLNSRLYLFSFSCVGMWRNNLPKLHLLPIGVHFASCRTVCHQNLQMQLRHLSGLFNLSFKNFQCHHQNLMTLSEFENLIKICKCSSASYQVKQF